MNFGSAYVRGVTFGFAGAVLLLLVFYSPTILQDIANAAIFWEKNQVYRVYEFAVILVGSLTFLAFMAERSIANKAKSELR